MRAAGHGSLRPSGDGSYRLVELLLDHHANVNQVSDSGNTALHYAMEKGQAAVAKLLIDNGADVGICNQAGKTPLEMTKEHDLIEGR
ncbi:MAG: ankyrin repeat domain-containing protein [Phycisphaerae bacterium]|nr:ankyrin repeat domain-containing protein [Phycisphaerae bacterium]